MSDSDGDIGPQAPALPAAAKKRRVLDGETVLLEQVAFVTNFTIHPRSKSFAAPICKHERAVIYARRDSYAHSVRCWRLRHHWQQGAAAAVA